MKFNIEIIVAIVGCWFLPILFWSIGESRKNWLVSSDQDFIKFRRPLSAAIGWILLALLYPVSLGLFMLALDPLDWVIALYCFGPLSLILCAVAINAASPKIVILDLAAQTCCETRGWFSQILLREQKLTNETRLLFCWTSNYHLLYLQTGSSGGKSRFLLGQSNSKKKLKFIANELSQRLAVPIVEGSLRQVAKL